MSKVTVQEIIDAMQQALDYANAKESDGYAEHWTLRADTHVSVDWSLIRRLIAKIKHHGIEVSYTPMTDDELIGAYLSDVNADFRKALQSVQQAVLARKGVAPNHIPGTGKMVLAEDGNCHNCGGLLEDIAKLNKLLNAEAYDSTPLKQAKLICEQAGWAVVKESLLTEIEQLLAEWEIARKAKP